MYKNEYFQGNLPLLLAQFNLEDLFIICCATLTIIVITILLMDNILPILRPGGYHNSTLNQTRNLNNLKTRIYIKLSMQLLVNDLRHRNNQPQLPYNKFPENHPAHLN